MLVDTSVWVHHLRYGNARLRSELDSAHVWTHLFVIGELACGNLTKRVELLGHFAALPNVPIADHAEVLSFVDSRHLMGRGLGWVDVHLLASATLGSVPLWTMDRRLADVARELGLALDA